jgi:hypothetical protein
MRAAREQVDNILEPYLTARRSGRVEYADPTDMLRQALPFNLYE